MARVNAQEYEDKQKEWRAQNGGGKFLDLPTFLRDEGKHTFTCIALAHIRSKEKLTWGVSALMLCVDPGFTGQVTVHRMYGETPIHMLIVGGYGYHGAYENGMPSRNQDPDKFDPDADILKEMLQIATCSDQMKGGKDDDRSNWNPTITDPKIRRSPYVEITMKDSGRTTQKGDPILETGVPNQIRERGDPGPYHVKDFRKSRIDAKAEVEKATAWFYADCEKQVRNAYETAMQRAQAARGGSGSGGGSDDGESMPFQDDDIPF
jgi:hypothetical protein